jgi:two-component system sensor histidine kinase VicK
MTLSHALTHISSVSKTLFFCYHIGAAKMLFANTAFTEFFDLEDIADTNKLMTCVHPDDQQHVISNFKSCIEQKKIEDLECRILRSGTERTLRAAAYLITENGDQYIAGHAEDITVYKENAKILYHHNSKKNAILNILSHDLAGPIGTISNLSEMINRELPASSNKKITQYVNLIDKISRRAVHMIRAFIDQEFIESQGISLLKHRVELISTISAAVQEYMLMDPEEELKFSCTANKNKIYAEIDEDKFSQVIQNLISNAMKFTPAGGEINVNIEDRHNSVLISVSDTGIGIPEKYHDLLFDKFTSARRKGLNGQDSHGLGMSIIKTIVEWHNGKIWFDTEEGVGTTFYIEFPNSI